MLSFVDEVEGVLAGQGMSRVSEVVVDPELVISSGKSIQRVRAYQRPSQRNLCPRNQFPFG
jgi:hypothetical protein